MLNEEDPVHAAIPPEALPAGPRPGLPSPRLTFTGRFRAGKAPEVLVAALALLAAPPADRGCGSQQISRSPSTIPTSPSGGRRP